MSSDPRGIHAGYSSELEPDSDVERRRRKRHDLAGAPAPSTALVPLSSGTMRFASSSMAPPPKRMAADLYDKADAQARRYQFLQLDAYDRHKLLVNSYLAHYGGKLSDFAPKNKIVKTDIDVIREHHQFLWDDEDDSGQDMTWEKSLAKRYYEKLFKEYCISDLSRFRENKIAMRWRTESEVVSGKGQFICGERKCPEKAGLASWEVNFGYEEKGVKKNALVKLRLCPDCSCKLNFHKKRNLASSSSARSNLSGSELLCPKHEALEPAPEPSSSSTEVWKKPTPRKEEAEKTVDEEIDYYLADLFA